MDDIPEHEWLSTKDAARHLGITPRVLYRLIDEGKLPAYKFGRAVRLRRLDIDIYLAGGRGGP